MEHLPTTWVPRVVVVGGGFAGINFIKKLAGEKVQIVLIDKNNYHAFQPLVYQVATAVLEPGAISSPLRGVFEGQDNLHFRMAEALAVEPDKYQLITSEGRIDYDYLVLANGATGNFYNNKDVKDHALTLNNLQEALTVREQFIKNFEKALLEIDSGDSERMNVVIVGGGPTGVELAGAMAELRKHVLPNDYPDFDTDRLTIYLVEAMDRILPSMSESSGRKAKTYLQKLGVHVLTGKMVNKGSDEKVELGDGEEIRSNLLVWAAGIKGNILQGFTDEQKFKGSLIVDEFNEVKGAKNIFAIGDLAFQKQDGYDKGLPMLAPVAIQQGKHLAKNIIHKIRNKKMKPFRYSERGVMATIGRNKAVVELSGSIRYGGWLGWLTWVTVHLFSILGLRRKMAIIAHWIWSFLTYDKGNRLILGQSKTR